MLTVLAYDLLDRVHLLIFAEYPGVVEARPTLANVCKSARAAGQLFIPKAARQISGNLKPERHLERPGGGGERTFVIRVHCTVSLRCAERMDRRRR